MTLPTGPMLERAWGERRIRIVHLFPDLLSVYGDSGNVRTLVVRAESRGISVSVERVLADATSIPPADLIVVGGGQDRDQLAVERALDRLGEGLIRELADGAAILAVCAGYQSLGRSYTNGRGRTVTGPGLFDVTTVARAGRLVGPVVATLLDPLADAARPTIVGFENHSGRTTLGPGASPLARVEHGSGNNGSDRIEGALVRPGAPGVRGLRIGTYLHGPLLPRNPHIADLLLVAALARDGQPGDLERLDDSAEWRAHDEFAEGARHHPWPDRLPEPLRRLVRPARGLIGF